MGYKDKEAQKAYQQTWESERKEARRLAREARRIEMREFVQRFKEEKGCTDCGQKYPYYILDLDHMPGFEKKFNIAKYAEISSMKVLQAELEKCEVVCANCHRRRTWERANALLA